MRRYIMFHDLKPGDLVKNIHAQWTRHDTQLSLGAYFVVAEYAAGAIALVEELDSGPIFGSAAFTKIDIKTLSKLERAIYGLAE